MMPINSNEKQQQQIPCSGQAEHAYVQNSV